MTLLMFLCLTFLCCGVIATAHTVQHPDSRLAKILPRLVQEVLYEFVLGQTEDGLFLLSEEDILSRMAVLGASGSGKSKKMYLLCASLMRAGRGFLLIDPHGDLAQALIAYAAGRAAIGDWSIFNRLHVLEPSRRGFRLDPFHNAPRRGTVSKKAYFRWLKARVDRVVKNLLRNVTEANQELMVRLRRWLFNIVFACGVALDANNTHVGLHRALDFTEPHTNEFEELMGLVGRHLPDYALRDFQNMAACKRPLDREHWTESTINRLRTILSPLVQDMFTPGEDSLCMIDLVRSGGFVIADLRETRDFSHTEKQVIGGILIDEVLIAKQAEEEQVVEHLRVPFVLVIDEFSEFLGEDLLRAFGAVRKYKLGIVFGTQDLSTLAKGELDLSARALSQCLTKVIFNMTWPEDLDLIVRIIGTGNLSFQELVHTVYQHRGEYHHIPTVDPTISLSGGKSINQGGSHTTNIGGSETETHAESEQENWSVTESLQKTFGDSWGENTGSSVNKTAGQNETLDIKDGHVIARHPVFSGGQGQADTKGNSRGGSASMGEGRAETNGGGKGTSDARAKGSSWGEANGESWGEAENWGWSLSLAFKYMTLAKIIKDEQHTGQLKMSIADQFEQMKQQIHGLLPRWCVVKLPTNPRCFLAQVAFVKAPFPTAIAAARAVEILKDALYDRRPYYLPEEELERIEEIEGAGKLAVEDADQDDDDLPEPDVVLGDDSPIA